MPENDDFEEALNMIRQDYLSRMPEQIKSLEKFLEACKANKVTGKILENIRGDVHKLKGSGTTYGYPEISEAGLLLQEEIDVNQNNNIDLLIKYTKTLIKACKDAKNIKTEAKQKTLKKLTQPNKNKPLLLAADDDDTLIAIIKKLFENDAEIITASDGKAAFKLLQERKPDLAILDDIMPKMTGLKLMDKLEGTDILKHTQIIMLTGSIGSRNIMRAVTQGATDYIVKPFDPIDLAKKVRALLSQQSKKVMIIDDDVAIRDLLEHKFRSKGFKVLLAEDGIEGLEIAELKKPDLIILDRMMPGLNGSAVLQKLKANEATKHIPILFLTAKHMEKDIVEGFELGAADYITKPFITEEVVARSIRLIESNKND